MEPFDHVIMTGIMEVFMKSEKGGLVRKPWFWNGSIAAALIAAVAVFAAMLQMEKNVLSEYEKGVIYVAAAEIPKGQVITEENFQSYFEEKLLDKNCIPQTALNSVEQVKGLIPVADIEQGVLLTEGMFEVLDSILENMQEPVIAGLKAEDLYQVAGGVLRAGDRIHIYSVNQDGETQLIWENIFVQQVFDQSGTAIGNDDELTAVQRMNVYMNKADVESFYTELAVGSLRVVKVCE